MKKPIISSLIACEIGLFLYQGTNRVHNVVRNSVTNKNDSANIIENDGKKGEFMIYFSVGPF